MTGLFNITIHNDSVILTWDKTPSGFSYYRLDIQHGHEHVEQLTLDIEKKLKIVPIENTCQITAVSVYGWHETEKLIKLASYDNDKPLNHVSDIEYFPIGNKLLITWKNPSACLPSGMHITVKHGDTTNERDLPIEPTDVLTQEVNWDQFDKICLTPTFSDGSKGKSICAFDIDMSRRQNVILNPFVEKEKLFLERQQNWSFLNGLTVTMVINDRYYHKIDWPDKDLRIYLTEYNVCNKYEIRLLEYNGSGLWQPRGYKLLLPETSVNGADVRIQVFNLGRQIWVTWNPKAWCEQESLQVDSNDVEMMFIKKYVRNSNSGALFPNPYQIPNPIICISSHSGVDWYRRFCRRRPDKTETALSVPNLNITQNLYWLIVNWMPLSVERDDYKIICFDESGNTLETNVTWNSTKQIFPKLHDCHPVTCILAVSEMPGKVSVIAYGEINAATLEIFDIGHYQTTDQLVILWSTTGLCSAEAFEVTLSNAFGEKIEVQHVNTMLMADFRNINNGAVYQVIVRALYAQAYIGQSNLVVLRTNQGNGDLQLIPGLPANMMKFEWINDPDCYGNYSLIIFENGQYYGAQKLVTMLPTAQFQIPNLCDEYSFGLSAHCPSGDSKQIGRVNYNGRQPMQPQTFKYTDGKVQVDWTTNFHCPPKSVSLVLQAESHIVSVRNYSVDTRFTTYDNLKLCTNYRFYLGFEYADGKFFISKATEETFVEGSHPSRYQKINNFNNGTVEVLWRFREGCEPESTSLTLTAVGYDPMTVNISGGTNHTVLHNVKNCAFYKVKISVSYKGGFVESNEPMEFETFQSTNFDDKRFVTFILDEELEVDWSKSVYCPSTIYILSLLNIQTGVERRYRTAESKYIIPLGPAKDAYQLTLSEIFNDKEIILSNVRTIKLDSVPLKPHTPAVRNFGKTATVWWSDRNSTFNISSYRLEITRKGAPTTVVNLSRENNVHLIRNLKNNEEYAIRLRKLNKYGASPPSDPAIFTSSRTRSLSKNRKSLLPRR